MGTGYLGTFVISWTQTEIDGLRAAPLSSLAVGAAWSWRGEAVRVDGPGDILVLEGSEETAELRRRAAKSVRRIVGQALDRTPPRGDAAEVLGAPDDPLLDRGFAVTDGRRRYTVTIIDLPDAPPLLMFLNEMPPAGADLWITHVMASPAHLNRICDTPKSVICFTPDTLIATPEGPRPVGALAEGDRVLTKDDGPQPILWIGARRMSGARLRAIPELRPIRIRTGAAGEGRPDADLLVSPDHRMLLKGEVARALFNTPEVLVRAKDLLNDRSVIVDHRVRHVTYVHLLFERHQVLWANGLESESFHPLSMSLDAIDPGQRAALIDRVPELAQDASLYGGFARRALSRSEAAILTHEGARRH